MDQNLRILGVNAHPHDFTHYAGTLGIHTSLGDKVTVVSVTSGESTHNERLHDELMKPKEQRDPSIINQAAGDYASVKAEELRKACARSLAASGITYRGPTVWMTYRAGSSKPSVRRASPTGQRTPGATSGTALQAASRFGPAAR